jgi:hypothetical protein
MGTTDMETTNDATRATAEAMPAISRRRFLLNTTMAGAAVAVAAPAKAEPSKPTFEPLVYAEDRVNMWEVDYPKPTPLEKVEWHMREIERLVSEDGGNRATVLAVADYGDDSGYRGVRGVCLSEGLLRNDNDMFAAEGGAA